MAKTDSFSENNRFYKFKNSNRIRQVMRWQIQNYYGVKMYGQRIWKKRNLFQKKKKNWGPYLEKGCNRFLHFFKNILIIIGGKSVTFLYKPTITDHCAIYLQVSIFALDRTTVRYHWSALLYCIWPWITATRLIAKINT